MSFVLQGHEVIFAARKQEMIDSINRHGYTVVTKGKVESSLDVRGVRAVNIANREFVEEVARADQIFTSVRPDNLPSISGILAQALLNRLRAAVTRPVDIFCCENLKNAGSQLERLIFTYVPFQFAQQMQDRMSFSAAVSDRIVSGQEMDPAGKYTFTADAVGDILFDTLHIKGDFDVLPPMKGIDNFPACIEEKLYILNCGHAVAAYLGYRRGYKYIHESMDDEGIRHSVVGAMLEAQQALQRKYGRMFHYAGFINEILASFSNAKLMDTIARVGRDPIRKLQADDRLIGPAKLAYRYNLNPTYLIQGCAAALSFATQEDPQAVELQKLVVGSGVEQALDTVSQLRPWNPISKLICDQLEQSRKN
jgi:mannitol-1-phosphate 5-dehydrogenase